MANETCPHCGAGHTNDGKHVEWTCGSLQWGPRVRMSDHCETRQNLATVTAERDTWMRSFDDVAHKLSDLQERLDSAPVGYAIEWADKTWSVFRNDRNVSGATRVRLVAEPEPAQEQ